MNDRCDALVAASGFVLKVQHLTPTVSDSAMATVGKLYVHPNGENVIPGEVQLSVDIRDIYESTRNNLKAPIIKQAEDIADRFS